MIMVLRELRGCGRDEAVELRQLITSPATSSRFVYYAEAVPVSYDLIHNNLCHYLLAVCGIVQNCTELI